MIDTMPLNWSHTVQNPLFHAPLGASLHGMLIWRYKPHLLAPFGKRKEAHHGPIGLIGDNYLGTFAVFKQWKFGVLLAYIAASWQCIKKCTCLNWTWQSITSNSGWYYCLIFLIPTSTKEIKTNCVMHLRSFKTKFCILNRLIIPCHGEYTTACSRTHNLS